MCYFYLIGVIASSPGSPRCLGREGEKEAWYVHAQTSSTHKIYVSEYYVSDKYKVWSVWVKFVHVRAMFSTLSYLPAHQREPGNE